MTVKTSVSYDRWVNKVWEGCRKGVQLVCTCHNYVCFPVSNARYLSFNICQDLKINKWIKFDTSKAVELSNLVGVPKPLHTTVLRIKYNNLSAHVLWKIKKRFYLLKSSKISHLAEVPRLLHFEYYWINKHIKNFDFWFLLKFYGK